MSEATALTLTTIGSIVTVVSSTATVVFCILIWRQQR